MTECDGAPWTHPAWLAEARSWIDGALARLGLAASGPVEQPHVRPWSTVLRVPTQAGSLWFKANMPALAHEAAVLDVLLRRRPDCLPQVLAADLGRGWMLQSDGGTRLRDLDEPARWHDVLPRYAELQIAAAADVEELLSAGAPDRRLEHLPGLYAELVAKRGAVPPSNSLLLGTLVPLVGKLCEELAALGVPETVQHDDLHSGNVFVRDDRYVFFDWGDACVAHPFFSLHVTLRVLAYELDLPEGARELKRFRDVYMEPWTRFGSREELRGAERPADLLGGIGRALAWDHILAALPPEARGEYADAVDDRLLAFLEATRRAPARGS